MATKKFKLNVSNGPRNLDLITSFSTAFTKYPNQPHKVVFEIASGQELPQRTTSPAGYKYQAIITGITHEDGSGKSFILKGILYDNQNGQLDIAIRHNFEGYYNSGSRQGFLKFDA